MHMGRNEYVIESKSISNMHLHMGPREYFFYYTKPISYLQMHMGRSECVIESNSTSYMHMHTRRSLVYESYFFFCSYTNKRSRLSRAPSHTLTRTRRFEMPRGPLITTSERSLAALVCISQSPLLCGKSPVKCQNRPTPSQKSPVICQNRPTPSQKSPVLYQNRPKPYQKSPEG